MDNDDDDDDNDNDDNAVKPIDWIIDWKWNDNMCVSVCVCVSVWICSECVKIF